VFYYVFAVLPGTMDGFRKLRPAQPGPAHSSLKKFERNMYM